MVQKYEMLKLFSTTVLAVYFLFSFFRGLRRQLIDFNYRIGTNVSVENSLKI